MSMGVEATNLCTFCNTEKENIQHLFWHCPVLQLFWRQLENAINEKCVNAGTFHLNEHVVIFGCDVHFKTDKIFDLILILAKSYIYKCKMAKELPQLQVFYTILNNRYKIEKHIALVNMKHNEFIRAWLPYTALCGN
jgi:hypothetical protein